MSCQLNHGSIDGDLWINFMVCLIQYFIERSRLSSHYSHSLTSNRFIFDIEMGSVNSGSERPARSTKFEMITGSHDRISETVKHNRVFIKELPPRATRSAQPERRATSLIYDFSAEIIKLALLDIDSARKVKVITAGLREEAKFKFTFLAQNLEPVNLRRMYRSK